MPEHLKKQWCLREELRSADLQQRPGGPWGLLHTTTNLPPTLTRKSHSMPAWQERRKRRRKKSERVDIFLKKTEQLPKMTIFIIASDQVFYVRLKYTLSCPHCLEGRTS